MAENLDNCYSTCKQKICMRIPERMSEHTQIWRESVQILKAYAELAEHSMLKWAEKV